ncbi:glycoside hydrolase family 1 protein [Corynebacterium auris]|uniref:glycoside hydrolase family 1 protein n=1 Tax=Corynebacterium auris TaxID=44750 RepID=UPI0025B541FE|nr:family 1 glycosylhydrolase [Corynebacterium auris]WJY67054.1 Beta-glucosidase A [Corynebacterium auris]
MATTPRTHTDPAGIPLGGMKIGTASAGLQIEGSPQPSNWSEWAAAGNIADGTTPEPTTDHWRRWREDNELMERLEYPIARVGVEWSRVEPHPGEFDEQALARYAQEYRDLKSRGIEPLVTLHHFGQPLWLERRGGWTSPEVVALYLRYVNRVLDELGDIVSDWVTINEPNVFATEAYLFGSTPPGRGGYRAVRTCLQNMAAAHLQAYELIHERVDNAKVTFAHHKRVFAPANRANPLHRALTPLVEYLFQGALEKAFYRGVFDPVLGRPRALPEGFTPEGVYADAIAINYYSRTAVKGLNDATFPNRPTNDLGWEIYPRGIVEVSAPLAREYGLPIWITENGTADNSESFRCGFVLDHLEELARLNAGLPSRDGAEQKAAPVERYYHWCFVDNWEWSEGMAQHFGVVALDDNLDRHVKPAGYMLRDLNRAGAITPEIEATYREPTAKNTLGAE